MGPKPIDRLTAHMTLCKEQAGRLMIRSAQLLAQAQKMKQRLAGKEKWYAKNANRRTTR